MTASQIWRCELILCRSGIAAQLPRPPVDQSTVSFWVDLLWLLMISGSCASGPWNVKLRIHECFFHDFVFCKYRRVWSWVLGSYSQDFLRICLMFFKFVQITEGKKRSVNVNRFCFLISSRVFEAALIFVHKRQCVSLLAWVELKFSEAWCLWDMDAWGTWIRPHEGEKNFYSEQPDVFLHDGKQS